MNKKLNDLPVQRTIGPTTIENMNLMNSENQASPAVASRKHPTRKQSRLGLALFSLCLLFHGACTPVTSAIELPVGEEFVLGPRRDGQIQVEVNNSGPGSLSLAFEQPNGERTTPDLLQAGELLQVAVPAGRSTVIHNLGPGTTRVELAVRAGQGLGMGFQSAEPRGYSVRPLSAEEAKFDFDLFRRVMQEVHPGYGRYEPAEATGELMDTIATTLDGGATDSQLYLDVSRVLAHLRCDHTKAELPEAIEEYRNQNPSYLPFTFRLFGDQMLVDRVASGVTGLERGDRVIRLNGREVTEVLSQISKLVSVDGYTDSTRYVEMENSSEYLGDAVDHFWPFLYGWADRWTIEIEAAGDPARDGRQKVSTSAITYPQWLALASDGERRVDFPDTVEFQMLDETTGYLSIGTFVNYRKPVPPEGVFEPIFEKLKKAGADRLVLDLRNCGGGSDDVPAVLATYLSDKRVKLSKRSPWVRTFRFGDLREYLSSWDESVFFLPEQLFHDLGNGYYEMNLPDGDGGDPPTRANSFDGEVVVLSSAANASGATMFIAMAQEHYGARVVGEPTGGSVEGPTAGVIFFLTLPNSGIKVRVPGMRSWLNVENPPPGKGVVPDVVVQPTADDWLAGRDAALETARSLPVATKVRR